MARIRTVKPEFWTDGLMVQLPHLVRLVYIALWNAADDHGYIKDEPERLAMELMPKESFEDVDSAIQLLAAAERLEWFVDEDGASYYRVAHWEDHQRVDHPGKSKVLRESSRKVSIPTGVRRSVAEKYGCAPGECKDASCFYCGMPGKVHWSKLYDGRPSAWVTFPGLELDHLEPEDEGGVTTSENIVLACRRCNRSKGTKHWFDFLSSLKFANHREMSRKLALEQGTGNREQGKENTPLSPQGGTGDAATLLTMEPAPKAKRQRKGKYQSEDIAPENAEYLQKVYERIPSDHPTTGEPVHKGPYATAARAFQAIIDAGEASARELMAVGTLYYRAETLGREWADWANRVWDTRPKAMMHVATLYGPEKRPYRQLLPVARKLIAQKDQALASQNAEMGLAS